MKKVEKEVSGKLDVRVDPLDLASPRCNNETEEPVDSGPRFERERARSIGSRSKLNIGASSLKHQKSSLL